MKKKKIDWERIGAVFTLLGIILAAVLFSISGFERSMPLQLVPLWAAAVACLFGGGAMVLFFGEKISKPSFEYPRMMPPKKMEQAQS